MDVFIFITKALYKCFNDSREGESAQRHAELEKQSAADIYEATKMPQNALINVKYKIRFLKNFI